MRTLGRQSLERCGAPLVGAALCIGALLLRCTPDPDPGQLGGVCVENDLCDFGLSCRDGRCHEDDTSGAPTSGDAGLGGGENTGGDGGAGGNEPGFGGSESGTGGSIRGNGGRGNDMGGSSGSSGGDTGSSGGSGGSSGTLDGGVGGSDTTNCVGLPSVRGRCNRNACLCPETSECFPTASAETCCAVAPVCN